MLLTRDTLIGVLIVTLIGLAPTLADTTASPIDKTFKLDQIIKILESASDLPKKEQFEKEREYQDRLVSFLEAQAGGSTSWYVIGRPTPDDKVTPTLTYDAEREVVIQDRFEEFYGYSRIPLSVFQPSDRVVSRLEIQFPIEGKIEIPLKRDYAKAIWSNIYLVGLFRPVYPYVSFEKNQGSITYSELNPETTIQGYHASLGQVALIDGSNKKIIFIHKGCKGFSLTRSFGASSSCLSANR
jgi:hypothetical protein